MAGPIRQPINIASLEKYINENVPEIKTPLVVKQVRFEGAHPRPQLTLASLDMVNPILRTS